MTQIESSERDAIIRTVLQYKTPNGKTDFKAAFDAHPEFKSRLGATNETGLSRLYGYVSYFKNKKLHKAAAVLPSPDVSLSPTPATPTLSKRDAMKLHILEVARSIPGPFSIDALRKGANTGWGNASGELNAWARKGWVVKVNQSQFQRTATFGQESAAAAAPLGAPATTPAVSSDDADASFRSPLDREAKAALLKDIAAKYTIGRRIQWRQAYDADPTLEQKLGPLTLNNIAALGWFYRTHVKAKKGRKGRAKPETNGQPVAAVAAVTPAAKQFRPLRCCPNCGIYLELVQQAFNATETLQPQP